jgi:hypothetical protein
MEQTMKQFIALNDFCTSNHSEEKGSHYAGSNESLLALVEAHWEGRKPGFTEGCVEVTVPAEGFFSGVVDLCAKPKAVLTPRFAPRREGEDPVLSVHGEPALKAPAKSVRIICYSHDLLSKDKENSTDAEWEVITILAECDAEPAPMPPVTMARNFLNLDGGTKGDFSPEDFAKSIVYWSQHVIAKKL